MRPRRVLARGGSPAARGKRSVFPQRSSCNVVRTARIRRLREEAVPTEGEILYLYKFKHAALLEGRNRIFTESAGYLNISKEKPNEFECKEFRIIVRLLLLPLSFVPTSCLFSCKGTGLGEV
ncbi:hypothetical protein SAMN05216243_1383 [Sediminibacillus albus]|uniref:Uncharacterized protein n=1 Tax=Sediminibacillus albus TaxID=407036 RepID=A0A1G8Y5F2_9BACI|nr:hypothetical protein SAMN05216243_1383 [Sediminibacillus albus]